MHWAVCSSRPCSINTKTKLWQILDTLKQYYYTNIYNFLQTLHKLLSPANRSDSFRAKSRSSPNGRRRKRENLAKHLKVGIDNYLTHNSLKEVCWKILLVLLIIGFSARCKREKITRSDSNLERWKSRSHDLETTKLFLEPPFCPKMREIVHVQAGQCGNQIGAKVKCFFHFCIIIMREVYSFFKYCLSCK